VESGATSQPEPDGGARRSGADIPPSVLSILASKAGGTPRVSLRQEDSDGAPLIDPGSDERRSIPQGRGSYQILGEVARGGMGVVLRGHDVDLGRDVAMKVLAKELADRPEVVRRFVEEAQIGGQLQHPGVVPVYELGLMADQRPYFTMKLVKGRTLSALLRARRSVEEGRARFLSIFESVCQTVAYAHSKGVIHRDLKPANVMVGAFGEVQVVDWGLAKVLAGGGVADEVRAKEERRTVIETVRSGPGSGEADSRLGAVMGTPAYMPPEQALGELDRVDERSDVFSLGAILCEILTGLPPYVAGEKERIVVLAARALLEPARERIEACRADPELQGLCLECLAPAPAVRPRNAGEVAERVHEHLARLEQRAHDAELAAERERVQAAELRRRQRLTLALGATVVLSVVAVGATLRSMERQRDAQRLERLAAARQALDDAQGQVVALQEEGRHGEALEVARAAQSLVSGGEVRDPAIEERAQRLLAQASARVAEQERQRDLARRNAALLAQCEELRMQQIEANFGFSPADLTEQLDATYAQAFLEYGIDPADEDLPATMETLRTSGIALDAALAFDDWASIRRRIHQGNTYEVESITALAFDLDPDPLRTRMRRALLLDDREALLGLARSGDLKDMPPSTIWVLSQGLTWFGEEEHAFRVVRDGVRIHPGDFLLNVRIADLHLARDQNRAALPYLEVARALRPHNGAVHGLLGDAYANVGNKPAAARAYLEASRLRPDYDRVWRFAGWNAMLAGDFEAAVAAYDRAIERFPNDDEWRFERDLARAFAGRLELSELADRVAAGERGYDPVRATWALVVHPEPAQRDPLRALHLLGPILESGQPGPPWLIAALAHLRLGAPDEALRCLDQAGLVPSEDSILPGFERALRAWAHHERGETGRAREELERAESGLAPLFQDGEDEWAGSVMFRMLEEVRGRVGD